MTRIECTSTYTGKLTTMIIECKSTHACTLTTTKSSANQRIGHDDDGDDRAPQINVRPRWKWRKFNASCCLSPQDSSLSSRDSRYNTTRMPPRRSNHLSFLSATRVWDPRCTHFALGLGLQETPQRPTARLARNGASLSLDSPPRLAFLWRHHTNNAVYQHALRIALMAVPRGYVKLEATVCVPVADVVTSRHFDNGVRSP